MNRRRLLKLAEFLETAELPGEFKMWVWANEMKNGRPACGTAACAAGWATTIPSFRRAGLQMRKARHSWLGMIPCVDTQATGGDVSAAFGRLAGFFGLAEEEAASIFSPDDNDNLKGKRGRNTVAKRIRKLVEAA